MKTIKKIMSFFLVLLMMIASLANTGFEIKAATNNQAIVYYYNANWTKANIHYKVGNGSWTSVPGVAMESSSDQSGYKWKYVIDLGSAEEATVCFNDGNGNWDSRNAKNYTVKAGSYGVKNETVTELAEFKTTISADQTSVVVGTQINLTGKVYNENGHRYNSHFFAVKNLDTNVEDNTRYYAQSEGSYVYSGTWTPEEAGNYEIFFYAMEYSARTAKSSVKVTVKSNDVKDIKVSISANKTSPIDVEKEVTFTATVENEVGHRYNTHQFSIKNLSTGKVEYSPTLSAYGPTFDYSWTPSATGTYEVTFNAQEYGSSRNGSATMVITVERPDVKVTFDASKTSLKVGESVDLHATVENQVGHRYNTNQFYAKNIATGEYVLSLALSAYDKEFNYSWTPTEAGTYEVGFSALEYGGPRYGTDSTIITVNKVTQNVAKIYYSNSSWSKANIHYQVGSGSWTAVPGVEMQASDNSSYTWMYTIDLGNASSANICFNNGNGSWDSRNAQNYQVGQGTYVVKNGSVSKVAD